MLFSGSSPRFYKTRHLDWFVYTFTLLSSFVLRFVKISFTKKNSTFLINYLNFHGICSNLEFWNFDTWGLYRIAIQENRQYLSQPKPCFHAFKHSTEIVQCCHSFRALNLTSCHGICLTGTNPSLIFTISVTKLKNWKELNASRDGIVNPRH